MCIIVYISQILAAEHGIVSTESNTDRFAEGDDGNMVESYSFSDDDGGDNDDDYDNL